MAGLRDWLGDAARSAGRTVESAREEFTEGKIEASLPRDEDGRAKIVCRRYAERRAVTLDGAKPECFEEGHDDCVACAEDISEGTVETW
ncbi:MAG: hypothetical protein ABEJ58_06730 [Halodesulfurarchaeum sp.]